MLAIDIGSNMIVGQYGIGVIDGPDEDKKQDLIPLSGSITFSPSITNIIAGTPGESVGIALAVVKGVLDEEGWLCTPGPDGVTPMYRGVSLFANDGVGMSNKNWTWSVVYRFGVINGATPTIQAHALSVTTNVMGPQDYINLPDFAPVPSSPGIGTPQALALLAQAEAAATESATSAEEAAAVALQVKADADAGVFDGEPGPAGPNTVPTGEAIVAAIQPGGAAYGALSGTIETGIVPLGSQIEQADYVAYLESRSSYSKMQLRKSSATGEVEVSCISPDGRHTTYIFENSGTTDDYRPMGMIYAGNASPYPQIVTRVPYVDLAVTGTWVAAAASTPFASVVGATFTATVTVARQGDSIRFHSYKDNRGGIWKISLVGGAGASVTASTYSATALTDFTGTPLFSNLAPGSYTLRGEFMGDDPAHVPSSGAGTARGWVGRWDTDTRTHFTLSVTSEFMMCPRTTLLSPFSNRDFAFAIKPTTGGTKQFVPYHGIKTAFKAEEPRYLNGGKAINIAAMGNNDYVHLTDFELVQHIYGRNPFTVDANLMEFWTVQGIKPTGKVTMSGRYKTHQSVGIDAAYVLMFPVKGDQFTECVTSLNNSYPTRADQYGQATWMVPEKDVDTSYAFVSSTNRDIAAAMTVHNPGDSFRRGAPNKNPATQMTYIEHRDANFSKIYHRLYAQGTVLPAGTTGRWSGSYIYMQGTSLHDFLTLS